MKFFKEKLKNQSPHHNLSLQHIQSTHHATITPEQNYLEDIIRHVGTLHQTSTLVNYFHHQLDITEHMRTTLINWLIDVHLRYKLQPQTLFIAVNIIDRYLSIRVVMRSHLQLVGITSLWIAAKYEETYQVPKIHNLVFICDSAYPAQQILEMESNILSLCQFNILIPTSFGYFQMINSVIQLSPKQYYFVRYLLQLSLLQFNLMHYSPNIIALSAIYLTNKLFHPQQGGLQHQLQKYNLTILTPSIKQCARELCRLWQKSNCGRFESLYNKFSQEGYMSVSRIKVNKSNKQKCNYI